MFCGDEVSSIVADIGNSYCKFGDGGQDSPRFVFSSDRGTIEREMDSQGNTTFVGDMQLRICRDNVHIAKPVENDVIDWDHIELLLQHGIDCMQVEQSNHPILISGNMFTSNKSKAKLFELFFERFNLPAAYIAHNAALSAVAAGRPTSLIVDFGATQTRVVPVVDGFVLNKSCVSTTRGGDWLDECMNKELTAGGHALHPWFDCNSGDRTKHQQAMVSPSFRSFHKNALLRDMKAHFCSVPTEALTETNRTEQLKTPLTIPPYELPDGTTVAATESICFLPDLMFAASTRTKSRLEILSQYTVPAHLQPVDLQPDVDGIPELVYAAVAKCDVDVRRDLMSNVLVVGGGSLIQGIPQRLAHDLSEMLPGNIKVKVNPMIPVERRFSSWIGGSVLSICGTFQQLWVSRANYDEMGVSACFD
eukprot:gene8814-18244_t